MPVQEYIGHHGFLPGVVPNTVNNTHGMPLLASGYVSANGRSVI